MRFTTLLKNPADWMQGRGPHSDIVMTSRIRLARNLRGWSFPGWSSERQRVDLMNEVRPIVAGLPEMKDGFNEEYPNLTKTKKQVLVERHLVSREHAARSTGCAILIDRRQSLAIMVNEEDHFRMQGIRAGLDLRTAYELVNRVDSELENFLPYAYDSRLGYLTACPTNVGTGMRASAMLHLPALVLTEQIKQVMNAVSKIGLAVRGLYGEGTEALGNLFQVSNQHTLGETESELISRIEGVAEHIVQAENNAREKLLHESPTMLRDQVGRAYATLRFAHILNSKEALTQLSLLRLGADLDLVTTCDRGLLDALLLEIQPAHLQLAAQRELSPEERDTRRAEITRQLLKSVPEPLNVSLDSAENAPPPESDDE
ncbi:protein arginine kinase [Verrucomicrobium spinosum]|uniref:protein arginine kinase n=2 Tax=Verrucomicrobium spinosum TaxID=2736 RepID=UPI000174557E|nr:protein arginine kinase [Verrucomicrobium spinosum]